MSQRHVHVVEDEDAIRRSLRMMLRVMGYEPHAHVSGAAFLDALPHLPAGCALLDIRMPEIDGLEVQRRLGAVGSDQPIVMMSGHGDLAIAAAVMEQGAVAFLEKPFSRATLELALHIAFLRIEDADGYDRYLEDAAAAVRHLDAADRQVLNLMARGLDADSIAQQTGLSRVVIEVARSRIFAGLGTDSITEVLRIAVAAERADAS